MVRRVTADDTDLLKDVRLRALREAPYAFWETLADVENDPLDEWIDWTASYAEPNTNAAAFVALADVNAPQADGMAGGYLDPTDKPLLPSGAYGSIHVAGVRESLPPCSTRLRSGHP